MALNGESVGETGNLWSAGADVNFQLGNFLWLPYDSKVGVRVAWNGGQTYDLLKTAGMEGLSSLYVGLQFSVDL